MARTMNILFVCEYEWLQSVVFDIHMMAEGLSLRGHNVYAVDYEWDDNSRIRFGTRQIDKAARIYPEARVMLLRPGFVRIRLKRPFHVNLLPLEYLTTMITHHLELNRILREKNIDVIVLYSVLTNGMSTIRLGKKYRVPVVHRNIDMLHKVVPNPVKRAMTKFFEKRVYPQVDKLLALTPAYRDYVVGLSADEAKTSLLLFPIDQNIFHPGIDSSDLRRKWEISEEDSIITFIGGLYRFGALQELISCFPEVIREIPNAKLVIVGDGPARPDLEQTVAKLGLSSNVIITGPQPFLDMPKYINMADICVNAFPTRGFTRDVFSAKILQYLACGKPTVSSALTGISCVISGEECGVIYADSVDDIVRELVALLKSPEKRAILGQAGLEYINKFHLQDNIVEQMETAIKTTVASK
ncbi:glycosyltransferase [Chloroflexota bacterium]